jgi:choline dehydrogenase-like flavoprotein
LQVLLLDAGPELDPDRHFPIPPPRSHGLLDRVLLGLNGQHVQARCFPCTRATRQFYVNDRDNPYTSAPGTTFNWFRGRQLGGRLHTWGRVVPRFSDWELQPGRQGLPGPDWPIEYADLAPFYARVEQLLGVHGERGGPPQLPDGKFIAPRPLTELEVHVRDEVARQWPTRRFRPAPVVRHNPDRVPVPLAAALETGNLTIRADAVVKRIVVDADGSRARGAEFIDRVSKKTHEARGRRVLLCASAIESVRILFNSACDQHPEGLGNSSGLLGRFLMDHCMVAVNGEAPTGARQQSNALERDADGDPYDMASMYLYLPGFRNITEPARSHYQGSFSILGSAGRPGRSFTLMAFGDMLPSADNRIRVDATRRDAWGIPAAQVECRHAANDRALISDMFKTLNEIASAAGLRVLSRFSDTGGVVRRVMYQSLWRHVVTRYHAFHPGGAIHEVGGARMGHDPGSSVVSRFNQCWDVPNLFVTDGSCFVSSGHQSHTLTIMAITARACDFIVAQHRSGAD